MSAGLELKKAVAAFAATAALSGEEVQILFIGEGYLLKKTHYSWVVCAACTLLMFCTLGIATTAFSAHQPYIISVNGFTNSQASGILTVRYLFCIVSTFAADRVIQCLGMRRSALAAMICEAVGFVIYGMADNFFAYCTGSAFVGLSQGIGGMVLVSMIIVTWFKSHQGTALGICTAGSGLATVVFPPVTTAVIQCTNLSTAFLVEAGFILFCAGAVFAMIRNSPAEKSTAALDSAQAQQNRVDNYGGDISRPAFVALCALCFLLGGIMVMDTGYVSILYAESGHSAIRRSLLLSINGVLLAVGKVLYGANADRKGGHWTNRVFLTLLLVGQFCHCCSTSGSYSLAVLAQMTTGIGLPVGTVGVSITAMNFSSQKNYPRQVKTMQTMVNVGLLAFSIVPGVLADASGHYRISFVLCAGMVAVYFLVLELLYFYKKNQERTER